MVSITYSLLDEQMTSDDTVFYKKLGERVSNLRKEQQMTQVEMAETLGISQQLVAAYEAGQRKIPVSLIPTLSQLFATPVEELLDIKQKSNKRGPASKLQLQTEQIARLPRTKQRFVMDMLDALIKQQSTG